MLDTNLLLAVAFPLVSNFAQIVHIPESSVPHSAQDLVQTVVGSPASPVDLYLKHRDGTEFWLRGGAVGGYSSPHSYFALQEPELLQEYTGNARLNATQALQAASKVFGDLVKRGNPATNGPPTVHEAGFYKGQRIPFFRIVWPNGNGGKSNTASFEVDGRDGRIVRLQLWDWDFFDVAFQKDLANKVNAANVDSPKKIDKPQRPHPSREAVLGAIGTWLRLCQKLGLDPGVNTNIDQVSWRETYLYTNSAPFPVELTSRVTFTNGAFFDFMHGAAFNHFSADACFQAKYMDNPDAGWSQFQGLVQHNWQELASKFESRIGSDLHLTKGLYAKSYPFPRFLGAERGQTGLSRALVYWHRAPPSPGADGALEDVYSYFSAEFDLQTGRVKSVEFHDPKMISALEQILLAPD
jgi:hypothetical protein